MLMLSIVELMIYNLMKRILSYSLLNLNHILYLKRIDHLCRQKLMLNLNQMRMQYQMLNHSKLKLILSLDLNCLIDVMMIF